MWVKATEKTKFIFQRNVLSTSFSSKSRTSHSDDQKSSVLFCSGSSALRFDLFHSKWKKSFLSMVQQWDCLMTVVWLKCYLLISPPLQMNSETALDLKNPLVNIAAVLRNRVFQQSSIFPRNVCVLKVPKTAQLSIVSYINQVESLHPPSD